MKRPNILFMMSDDHSANAISCYGSILAEVFQTPNMDRIANEGVRLDKFFATNSICTPARATIMTGQYGQVNGVRCLSDFWDAGIELNLAKILQKSGYETSLFGKWHLGCKPEGFDEFKYLEGKGSGLDVHAGQQGVYQNPTFAEKGKDDIVAYEGYVTDIITDMVVDYLQNRDEDKPFFMMCHHKAPHDFWEYPERHEHLFDGVDIPLTNNLFEDRSHRDPSTRDYGSSVTPRNPIRSLYVDFCKEDYVTGPLKDTQDMNFEGKGISAYQKYLKDYLRTVKGIDDSVGIILGELEKQGVLEDTIVIYTSDQGMFLGEHDYQDKRWSFEESLRAPFMIRYPKLLKQGTVEKKLMANIDIAPTLLDFAGVEIPQEMQGESCVNMLQNKDGFVRDSIYFRYWMHRANFHDNPSHYGIRTNEYKLTFYYGLPLDVPDTLPETSPAGWEFYDLVNDPYENFNVYSDPKYADIIAELKIKLDEEKKRYNDEDEKYPEILALREQCK
ncbi:MAG: sulfatase [Clostridia bacterium]